MRTFNFQERGGLTSVLNKFFCALLEQYRIDRILFDEVIVGGLFTNLGLVNNKNHNVYPDILERRPTSFKKQMNILLPYLTVDVFGIREFEKVLLDPVARMILDTYFNFSEAVVRQSERILVEEEIDPHKTFFVWARKTDKGSECVLPSAAEYKKIIDQFNDQDLQIILQTDDRSVITDFENVGMRFKTLSVLPFSEDERGFHLSVGCLPEKEFIEKTGMTKSEYNIRFMTLVQIASLSQKVLVSPGNLQCFIPMMRRNLTGVYIPHLARVNSPNFEFETHGMSGIKKICLPGDQKRKVLYIGNLGDTKTIKNLLSIDIPQNIDLVFIGDRGTADPELFSFLLERVKEKNIHYFGAVYGNEYRNTLYSSDAVVIPFQEKNNKRLIFEGLISENAIIAPMNFPEKDVCVEYGESPDSIRSSLVHFSKISDQKLGEMKKTAGEYAKIYEWQ